MRASSCALSSPGEIDLAGGGGIGGGGGGDGGGGSGRDGGGRVGDCGGGQAEIFISGSFGWKGGLGGSCL